MSWGKVFALIPARGGSKGMPKKNISPLGGYSLIAFSIVAAKLCSGIKRAIISTDSPETVDIARFYGADVPFLRPPELVQDDSPDIDPIRHALGWLETHEGSVTQMPFIWKHPQFSFVSKVTSLLPDSMKWNDHRESNPRELVRFSKEKMLFVVGDKE